MYKRPQRGESEEDLLKLQEQFFKDKAENKIKPAAEIDIADKKPIEPEEECDEVPEQLSNTFEEIPRYKNIGKIVERVDTDQKAGAFVLQKTGFPVAKRRDPSVKSGGGSIFGKQFKRLKTNQSKSMEISDNFKTSDSIQFKNLPSESYILMGNERDEIHKENLNRLNEMTEEEILEERNKLMSTMDPAIVAYLKSKRHKLSSMEKMSRKSDMEVQIEAAQEVQMQDIGTVNEILNQPESEKWLNFDKMEIAKLAWMKDIKIEDLRKDEKYEARFDFSGWLLPYNNEINEKNRILYHHGEEPGRPGYTLQELFQLCRSNISQQKITALNAIANLLSLETSGVYDKILDIPLEQLFFVLRFCLDDNATFVLNSSIKAMRNLFYYPIDEVCLDSILGFGIGIVQPTLSSEKEDNSDDYTINDQQLAETNLIKCLSRTEILTRIRYVINTVRPPLETICYCLELLIRLARDSERIASLIFECQNLIPSILTHFVPKVFKEDESNLNYGVPLKQAIKLCRILSTRNKKFAVKLINEYNIMDSVLIYLSNEHFSSNTTGVQLQIECLHLWNVFVQYDLALEQFIVIQPILLQMLHYHAQKTNQDMLTSYTMHGHVSALLILIGSVAKKHTPYILPYFDLITKQALNKWTTQFNELDNYSCGKLMIISSLLNCLTSLYDNKICNNRNFIDNTIKKLVLSQGFKIVTGDIKGSSNILCKHEAHKPTKNLTTVEVAVWSSAEHIVPILQTKSCLPFLNALSRFICKTQSEELKLLFLTDINLHKYYDKICGAKTYNLTSNWFTMIESEFLINILKISYSIYKKIDTTKFYDIAVKCLCIFNEQQKDDVEYLFKNIIFNKNYYPSQTLLQNLEIGDENTILNDCIDHLNDIFTTYIEVLGLRLDVNNFADNLCVDIKTGNIIPIDWIYSPIIVLYANSQKENKTIVHEAKLTFTVENCLRWIFIYEKYFSSISLQINSADKFCRLACVFLASDDLFFVPAIHNLLQASFKHFVENSLEKLDFNKPVHGLTNFQDFYTQLLEQYQGVSYGDVLFSNFILIPLMQRHNVQYRKLLWSEYAGIVQICSITSEQLICGLNLFLEPAETDVSLLKSYRKIVLEGRVRDGSVLKIVAKHHLDTFVKNKRSATYSFVFFL